MIKKVEIIKEGIYYTLYINDNQCGCGDLKDLVDELDEYIIAYRNGEFDY